MLAEHSEGAIDNSFDSLMPLFLSTALVLHNPRISPFVSQFTNSIKSEGNNVLRVELRIIRINKGCRKLEMFRKMI